MKAKLEFNLPEENEEFQSAVHAQDLNSAIWDLLQYFRQKIKYEELTPEEDKAYTKVRQEVISILEENGVLEIVQ